VYFHVGAPKTGSTFLQEAFWANRSRLVDDGVCYPLDSPSGHLAPTIDLCERSWGGRRNEEWEGAWNHLAATIRASNCPRAVFSAELMGLATPRQAARAVASVQPAEVHLVFTARDFARQLPSDWQEQVKHRHTVTLTTFVDDLVRHGHDAPAPFGELFWGLHDAAYVLARWSDVVPPHRIHVVTVPRSGAPPDVLWSRIASLLGLTAKGYDLSESRDNTSMGVVETEFMRRFNVVTRGRLSAEHGPVLNRTLGQEILASRPGSRPIRLPRKHFEWAVQRSAEMVAAITRSGYDVLGDLGELVPTPPPPDEEEVVPEKLPPAAVNKVAYHAVAGLVDEVLSLRGRARTLAERLEVYAPGSLEEIHRWRAESADQPDGGRSGWTSVPPVRADDTA